MCVGGGGGEGGSLSQLVVSNRGRGKDNGGGGGGGRFPFTVSSVPKGEREGRWRDEWLDLLNVDQRPC